MEIVNRIAGAAIGAATLIGLSAPPGQAAYIVHLTQEGSDVVATGSGTIDLAGLSVAGPGVLSQNGEILPSAGDIATGPADVPLTPLDVYTGFTGPTSFGDGGDTDADSGSGDTVGLAKSSFSFGVPVLFVPKGYISGSVLSDTSTYDGASFASLGATPGTYKWAWGSGADADSFTLKIGVPEPSTWVMMLAGFAGLGWLASKRKLAPA
jgi:hypothetical protein